MSLLVTTHILLHPQHSHGAIKKKYILHRGTEIELQYLSHQECVLIREYIVGNLQVKRRWSLSYSS